MEEVSREMMLYIHHQSYEQMNEDFSN